MTSSVDCRSIRLSLLLAVSAVTAVGCGLASSVADPPMSGAPPAGTISGTATLGTTSSAQVTAYAIMSGETDRIISSGTTDGQGNFTLSIGEYCGPVLLEVEGGTFTDEATGREMPLANGVSLNALLRGVKGGSTTTGVLVTPLTSMAQMYAQHMTGGMTPWNIEEANGDVGAFFSVSDILHVVPMNPLVLGSGKGATTDAVNYGMALAAMSQYAASNGVANPSGIVTALMEDASDGVLDGKMGTTSISVSGMGVMEANAGTAGLAAALTQFAGSSLNQSGVTVADMQSLVAQLNGSSGQLQDPDTGEGTVSGTAIFGPLSGAAVAAYSIASGEEGSLLGAGVTDEKGNFTVAIGSYAGAVLLEVSGGSYTDYATATTMAMGAMMTSAVPTVVKGAQTTGIEVTPLTSMAQRFAAQMVGGMTAANIASANADVGTYFSICDILQVTPLDPGVASSGTLNLDAADYGMSLAAMSQYAGTLGMANSSGIITAMMDDASDGVMDGKMDATPISLAGMGGVAGDAILSSNAGTSGLATSMTQFLGSSFNKSGVTAADIRALVSELTLASGSMN